jgi:hypothetical protein
MYLQLEYIYKTFQGLVLNHSPTCLKWNEWNNEINFIQFYNTQMMVVHSKPEFWPTLVFHTKPFWVILIKAIPIACDGYKQ